MRDPEHEALEAEIEGYLDEVSEEQGYAAMYRNGQPEQDHERQVDLSRGGRNGERTL
jgi:hypothetical protein